MLINDHHRRGAFKSCKDELHFNEYLNKVVDLDLLDGPFSLFKGSLIVNILLLVQ